MGCSPKPPVFTEQPSLLTPIDCDTHVPPKWVVPYWFFLNAALFPLSCRQGWDLYPDWLYMFIVSECRCAIARPMNPSPRSPLLCILATCMQPGLNETIKRPDSPVSPVTLRSNGASTWTIVSLQLNKAHKIRHKTWQPAVLPPIYNLASDQWNWIEGCHILAVTLFSNCYSQNELWQHVSTSYQAPPLREKWLSAGEISYWHGVE